MIKLTIQESIDAYLDSLIPKKKLSTVRAYGTGLKSFTNYLSKTGIDVHSVKASLSTEKWLVDFIKYLKNLSPSTVNIYYWSVYGWFGYLVTERILTVDLKNLKNISYPDSTSPDQSKKGIFKKPHFR